MIYQCSVCGKEVQVLEDGTIIRSCEHEDSPIIANMSAVCVGQGAVK